MLKLFRRYLINSDEYKHRLNTTNELILYMSAYPNSINERVEQKTPLFWLLLAIKKWNKNRYTRSAKTHSKHLHLMYELLDFMLTRDADVNAVHDGGVSPIFVVSDGYTINRLIEYGANVHHTLWGMGLACSHAMEGNNEVIEVLAKHTFNHQSLIANAKYCTVSSSTCYIDVCRSKSLPIDERVIEYLDTGVWPEYL